MVTDRALRGTNLTRHPLVDEGELGLYARMPPIMCVQAQQGGRLETVKGEKTFHAGDWICTDYPATYAWVLDQQTFAVQSYTKLGIVSEDQQIVFPIAEADHEVESSMYTGRQEVDQKGVAEVELLEANDPLSSEHMTGVTPANPVVTPARPSHPPTKATLPQQNPQKAMSQGKPAKPK